MLEEGSSPTHVAITLGIREKEVNEYYRDYWSLTGMYSAEPDLRRDKGRPQKTQSSTIPEIFIDFEDSTSISKLDRFHFMSNLLSLNFYFWSIEIYVLIPLFLHLTIMSFIMVKPVFYMIWNLATKYPSELQ